MPSSRWYGPILDTAPFTDACVFFDEAFPVWMQLKRRNFSPKIETGSFFRRVQFSSEFFQKLEFYFVSDKVWDNGDKNFFKNNFSLKKKNIFLNVWQNI